MAAGGHFHLILPFPLFIPLIGQSVADEVGNEESPALYPLQRACALSPLKFIYKVG